MLTTGVNNAVTLPLSGTEAAPSWRKFLIGESPQILELCEMVRMVAPKRITVLITGETGTGKEVVARAIHAASTRAALPFVAANCTALPASLVESELFGHTKGAFTGAHASRVGYFERANHSTLFLDEIGDLALESQAKLLRVLQEHEFQRVGSPNTVRVDVRVVAASNVDLSKAVSERRFREDLYYRLNVLPIHLAPLRERRSDIPLLVEFFLQKNAQADCGPRKQASAQALDYLMEQNWPGNVRQLEHMVQMACIISGERPVLQPRDFAFRPGANRPVFQPAKKAPQPLVTVGQEGLDFDRVVGEFERSLVYQALALTRGNKARAAELLRMKRTTLLAKMKALENGDLLYQPVALLVEEDVLVRKLLFNALKTNGYRVLEAATFDSAVELFNRWKDNIELLVSSSHELESRLRCFSPALDALIVSERNEIHSASSYGARTEILLRPFSPENISAALSRLGKMPDAAAPSESQPVCA